MRIADFLEPHLDGVSRVTERHSGTLSLEQYVTLPDGIIYERVREPLRPAAESVPRKRRDDPGEVLLLTLLGPDEERFGREDDALAHLAGLGPGQRCAVMIGYPAPALPVHRLLDALAESGSQLIQLSSLEHQHLHAAAMAVQVGDRLVMPRDPFGQRLVPEPSDGSDSRALRRLTNEFVLLDFVSRNLRAQVFRLGGSSVEGPDAVRRRDELERWTEQARAQAEQARVDAEASRSDAQLARAETEAVRAEADELRREVARLHSEIDRISASTSFLVGRRLVETARHPVSAPRLPLDLARLWRRRGRSVERSKPPSGSKRARAVATPARPAPAPAAPTSQVRTTVEDHRRRFAAHLAFEVRPRTRPVVVGILTDSTAGALAYHATVNRIVPNDARVIVERTEPDLLLVETAALGPGRPWAYLGDASASDRTARLMEAIDLVHALGRAAVLVRDARQPAAGLIPLEARFDLVVDAGGSTSAQLGWSRGVQLARFHPLGAPASRSPVPLLVGGWPARAPYALGRFTAGTIAALEQQGLEIRADPDAAVDDVMPTGDGTSASTWLAWADAPAEYRTRAVGVANPLTVPDTINVIEPRILEQLACGMEIVSGPHLALAAGFGADVRFVSEPAAAALAVREAVDAHRTASDSRTLVRRLFERHATPVMLSALTRQFTSIPDPLAHRWITAIVVGGGTGQSDLIESLIVQGHRPHEVLLADAPWSAGERDALEGAGIRTRLLEGDGGEIGWSAAGSLSRTEWLTVWPTDRPVGPAYLLDLAAGAEMSQGDVVGYGPDQAGSSNGVGLGAAIVRRSFATTSLAGRPLQGEFDLPVSVRDFPAVSVGPEEPAR